MSDQPTRLLGTKPPVANVFAATSVPTYSKDDLQQILKTVLEAQAPAPTPVPLFAPAPTPTPIIAEVAQEKLKTRSPDVYRRKSHMDCYNFCQQCEDYFAIAGAMGSTQIFFATSFLWNQISFYWQQYKQKRDIDSSILVTWVEFKTFLRRSLGDS